MDVPRMDAPITRQTRACLKAKRDTLRLSDLPEELLDSILRYVKDNSSPTEFWACIRTCRQWHRIGLGIYKGLDYVVAATIESSSRRHRIHYEEINTEVKLLTDFVLRPPSDMFLSELRSLTIHVRHMRIAANFAPAAGRDLFDSLSNALKRTRKLSTFSFRFADEGWDFPNLDVPAVPQSRLAKLVKALPNTVVNIELDTCGTDVPPSADLLTADNSNHLCAQISKRVHQLCHLRLRVSHVCDALLVGTPEITTSQGERRKDSAFGKNEDGGTYNDVDYLNRVGSEDAALRTLTACWHMKGMIVWVPWGQHGGKNSFARVVQRLPQFVHPTRTTILIVEQCDESYQDRRSIVDPDTNPYTNFRWSAACNQLRPRLDIYGFTERFHCYSETKPSIPHRVFELSGRWQTPDCPFPYMTEWALEDNIRWTQQGHLGPRYPVTEGDAHSKPFGKATIFTAGTVSPRYFCLELLQGPWTCLFPGCGMTAHSLHNLRGHQVYRHPTRPHSPKMFHGRHSCPLAGCERVGERGFLSKNDFEDHLLGHHVRPCTQTQGHIQTRSTV